MKYLKEFLMFLRGKKTFLIGICGVIYGIGTNNQEIIYLSLGMMGLRDAIRCLK